MKNAAVLVWRCMGVRCVGMTWFWGLILYGWVVNATGSGKASAGDYLVGLARVEITPEEPIRLTGYAVRQAPSQGVEQRLWAKALAVSQEGGRPAVLVTIDNCGISADFRQQLLKTLGEQAGLSADRLVLAVSHTHTGPCTTGWAPNIFARDIAVEEQHVIDRYTLELRARVQKAVLAALRDRRPARLGWAQGAVGFAKNRRTAGGPVDHSLPVLKVEGADGNLVAVVANYACHCTALGGDFNKVCGDWSGYAQEQIERDCPGVTALVTIGCGADANPDPRGGPDGGLALAQQHGQALAAEVRRLLSGAVQPLTGPLRTDCRQVELPYGPHFRREEWEERAKQPGIVGYHARKNLARLDGGESLPSGLHYEVVTWDMGGGLAWVFLPGEVVVDYALRLKRELDPSRLWVSAYANSVPCYIPSRRILSEGGYEAEMSLWYYDRPGRLAPETEDLIVRTVRGLLPAGYGLAAP